MEVRKADIGMATKDDKTSVVEFWLMFMMVSALLFLLVVLSNALFSSIRGNQPGTTIVVFYEFVLSGYFLFLLVMIGRAGIHFRPFYAYLTIADVFALMVVLIFPFSQVFQGISAAYTPQGLSGFISLLEVPELDLIFMPMLAGAIGLLFWRRIGSGSKEIKDQPKSGNP